MNLSSEASSEKRNFYINKIFVVICLLRNLIALTSRRKGGFIGHLGITISNYET